MKLRIIQGVLLVVVAMCGGMFAQQREDPSQPKTTSAVGISNDEEFSSWLTYYYQHPRPGLIVPSIRFLSANKMLMKSNPALTAFYARVLAANPQMASSLAGEFKDSSEDQKTFLALALWAAGTNECRNALKNVSGGSDSFRTYLATLQSDNEPPDLLTQQVDSPEFLDALWGSFFATGDERYIKRIISVLPLRNIKNDAGKLLIGGAADWSLTSNAIQHEKVMAICQAELPKANDVVKPLLADVIARAKKQSSNSATKERN